MVPIKAVIAVIGKKLIV